MRIAEQRTTYFLSFLCAYLSHFHFNSSSIGVLWFDLGTLLFLLFLEKPKIQQTSSAQDI